MESRFMPQIDRIREASIPQAFPAPQPVMSREKADGIVSEALAKWQPLSRKTSLKVATTMQQEFPDQAHPEDFWHSEASGAFRDFFVWGHDHDFGNGVTRAGAMGTRHREITAEALSLGMLPSALKNMQVLDVGCWTGGDLLVLAGLGGWVTAIDEHPIAAKATRRLVALLRINAHVVETSLYADRQEWAQRFDFA